MLEPLRLLACLRARLGPRGWWTACGTLPVVVYGAYLRSAGLNPPSLAYDDAWVAALSKLSFQEIVANGSSSPPLFNLCVSLCIWVLPDPELSAQALPFFCSLLAIAAVAWGAHMLTGNPACAVFAALVYASDPFAVIYAARVKQYSSDALLAAVELALFCVLARRYSRRTLWLMAGVMACGLLLSTVSLFVVAAFLPVTLLAAWCQGVRDRHLVWAGSLVVLAAIGVYFGLVRGSVNEMLTAYWRGHFLQADSVGALLNGVWEVIYRWGAQAMHELPNRPGAPGLPNLVTGPTPGAGWIGVSLMASGCVTLWLRRKRVHLCGFGLLFLGVVTASALGRFPLGGGRVELFLAPFVACLLACGLSLTAKLKNRNWRKVGPVLGLAFAVFQLPVARAPTYPGEFSADVTAPLVEELKQAFRPGDGLWANKHGTPSLVYYGSWPGKLVADPRLSIGYRYELEAPGFSVGIPDPAGRLPPRVFVFVVHTWRLRARASAALAARGYRMSAAQYAPGAMLMQFDLELR